MGESWNPVVRNESIPGAFDLGLYYSENKDELQVAKIAEKDRATHLYVVGATGTGKTKFLECLIFQDIIGNNGVGVIDPHGDLIEDIKGLLACHYHWSGGDYDVSEQVVLIDPTDPIFTVTFNPLENIPGVSVAEQAGELVSAFRKIWSDSWGVRMEDLMRNSLIALGETQLTLAELPAFLTSRPMRQAVLEKVANPTTRDYFRRFEVLTDRGQITWIEPVMNKINAFLADERLRQMISSPKSSFSLREIMDQRKCLLIKLDKGKLRDSADLIGSLFMAKIQMAAFSRSGIPERKRVPFYLYIDEFQNFATDSFSVVLSEARKYRLSLTMAHQSLSQIPDDLRGLILSSAGVQVYFRVNRQDAQLLAKEAFEYSGFEVKYTKGVSPTFWSYAEEWEFKTEELQHLPPRMCYVKHKIRGGIVQLRTIEIEPAWEALGIDESEYSTLLSDMAFGSKYLIRRDELAAQAEERLHQIEEIIQSRRAEEKNEAVVPPKPVACQDRKPGRHEEQSAAERRSSQPAPLPPESDTRVEREHKRLQNLIKLAAEKYGYLATIEQPTPDGQGRIHVGLERDDSRIACEISVTTNAEQELANIQKCLKAGYDPAILCSTEKKTLAKAKSICREKLPESDLSKVLFFEPDELLLFFEEEAAKNAGSEGRVKGYKVKVNYQSVQESDKKSKRQAIANILLQSFRRDKKDK